MQVDERLFRPTQNHIFSRVSPKLQIVLQFGGFGVGCPLVFSFSLRGLFCVKFRGRPLASSRPELKNVKKKSRNFCILKIT